MTRLRFARLLGTDRGVRARIVQFGIASGVYVGSALALVIGVGQGWLGIGAFHGWAAFVAACLLLTYIALRSGFSVRFLDPSLSVWQLVNGVTASLWGFAISGPMRTSALFPLMVIFAFGAFTLRARQLAWLTAYALVGLGCEMLWQDRFGTAMPAVAVGTRAVNLNTWVMLAVALSGLAVVASRLSGLRARLISQREQLARAFADVERLAESDELTGLPNRRSMQAHLERVQRERVREGETRVVALLDIDHFKRVNDELGHDAGDAVLREFARAARMQLRESDVLGRWGGEEFLLVARTHGDGHSVDVALERIRTAVRCAALPGRIVTFSTGVACFGENDTARDVVMRADRALYSAKDAGRDCVRRAD